MALDRTTSSGIAYAITPNRRYRRREVPLVLLDPYDAWYQGLEPVLDCCGVGVITAGVAARAASSKVDGALSKKKLERYNLGLEGEASQ